MSGQEAGEERKQQRKRSGAGGERWGSDGVCQGEDGERRSENPALALATWRSSVTWIGACVGEDEMSWKQVRTTVLRCAAQGSQEMGQWGKWPELLLMGEMAHRYEQGRVTQ